VKGVLVQETDTITITLVVGGVPTTATIASGKIWTIPF
jgi:hypothetical protein